MPGGRQSTSRPPAAFTRGHELATAAIAGQRLPAGVLTLVHGASVDVSLQLVRHSDIAAVAFTGSFKGGAALQAVANARPNADPVSRRALLGEPDRCAAYSAGDARPRTCRAAGGLDHDGQWPVLHQPRRGQRSRRRSVAAFRPEPRHRAHEAAAARDAHTGDPSSLRRGNRATSRPPKAGRQGEASDAGPHPFRV